MGLCSERHGIDGNMVLRVKGNNDVWSLIPEFLLVDCGGHSFAFLAGLFCWQSLVVGDAGYARHFRLTWLKETPGEEQHPNRDVES